jgi:hypothetical protein
MRIVPLMDRPGIVERLALAFIVIAIVVVGTRTCFGPEETLAFLFYDDAYYYLGVSRNLAAGAGSTFDGINPTNGYHPLWCWLLVPVFWIASDPGVALRVVAVLWFALAAGAPVAVWLALRPRSGPTGAVIAAALFGLQPFLSTGLSRPNGLETPLYAVLIAVALWTYGRVTSRRPAASTPGVSASEPPSPSAVAGLGAVLGLVTLARFDGGFLGVAVAALLALYLTRSWGMKVAAGRVATLVAVATLLAGPSLVWNVARFGHPVPVSGRVVGLGAALEREELGGVASPSNLRRRAGYVLRSVPVLLAGSAVSGTPNRTWIARAGVLGGAAVLATVAALFFVAIHNRARAGPALTDPLAALGVFAAIHYAIHAGWIWTSSEAVYRLYYYVPETMLAAAVIGAVAGPALDGLRSATWRRAIGTVGLVLLAANLFHHASARRNFYAAEHGAVRDRHIYAWVRAVLPPDAILGARDAGKLGFFSGRPVVNLDGLINDHRLFAALRDGTEAEYLCESPIDYLFYDRPWLDGFDPSSPDRPPPDESALGGTLHRLHRLPGCSIREVEGATDDWAVIEVVRD